MRTWVKVVAVSHGLGAAFTLGLALVGAALQLTGQFSSEDAGIMWVPITLLAALGLLQAAITVGLWQHRVWARTGAIAIAAIVLLTGAGSLPALVTLVVLFSSGGRALFIPEAPGVEGSAPSLD